MGHLYETVYEEKLSIGKEQGINEQLRKSYSTDTTVYNNILNKALSQKLQNLCFE